MSPSQSIPVDTDFHLNVLTTMAEGMGLSPLAEEKYPRSVERGGPDEGYYIALGLVMSVWMITPLSCAYLIWYAIFAQSVGLTGTIFAAYAITEVIFAIYQHYLIHLIQAPCPPSTLPLAIRHKLLIKVLQAGLEYSEPSRPVDDDTNPDPLFSMKEDLYSSYMAGTITKAQYHHLLDGEYEMSIGMQESRRVAMMTKGERGVIDAFVEEKEGDREKRLRAEVEGNVGKGIQPELEGVFDEDGNVLKLHSWDRRAIEFRERLRTWFDHAPWETIKRDNILIWVSWVCFTLPLEEALLNPEHTKFLHWIYDVVEARTGTSFETGHNSSIRVIRYSLDPVNAKSRPLILYALSNTINWILSEIRLPYLGMGRYSEGGVDYLIRIPPGWTPEKGRHDPNSMPIVFLYGLGFGLLQNHLLLENLLSKLGSHPLIVPIAHHTSMSFFNARHLSPWTRPEFVGCMKKICERWGFWEEPQEGQGDVEPHGRWGGLSVLSHSNGSVGHGWLLKDCPSMVRRSTFVDPVVFCLWEGDVCHSFIYRKPKTALELLLYYFIATELGISNYIQRHFDWADNCLFLDEIPHISNGGLCQVFLGAKDIIVDAKRVRKYFENHGVKVGEGVWWDEDGGHGDGLSGVSRDRVVNFVGTGNVGGWDGIVGAGQRKIELNERRRRGEDGAVTSDSERTYVEETRKDI